MDESCFQYQAPRPSKVPKPELKVAAAEQFFPRVRYDGVVSGHGKQEITTVTAFILTYYTF